MKGAARAEHREATKGALVLATGASATGWYAATRVSSEQHFDSCRELADGTVILAYTHGAGDTITTSVEPRGSAVVVSLHLDPDPDPHPAIALHGQAHFDTSGGLRGRPVQYGDGTALSCSSSRS